jgi:hypothetical protein
MEFVLDTINDNRMSGVGSTGNTSTNIILLESKSTQTTVQKWIGTREGDKWITLSALTTRYSRNGFFT